MIAAAELNKNLNILIVDDHGLTREMVKSILRALGFANIATAENGTDAMQKIYEETIELVICDWNMPQTSGIELLRAVRRDAKFKTLPFIMLTAEANRENVVEAAKEGVNDYIIKPFTAQILHSKIESVVAAINAKS